MVRFGKYILLLLLLMMMVSCIKEDIWDDGSVSDVVDVCMELDLMGEDADTKAVIDPEVGGGTEIKDVICNFWVLQYDGTGDDARLVGEPQYFSDMSVFLKPVAEGGYGGRLKLVKSTQKNRVVILANTFDPLMTFPKESDVSDLKKRWRSVTDTESFLSESDSDKYLIFNGSTEVVVSENTVISCLLQRNVAKVVIRIINSSSNVTVNSWQIRNVPSVSYYYTNYDLPPGFPAISDFTSTDYQTFEPSSPLGPKTGASYPAEEEYVVYLPVNKRGTDLNVTSEGQKNYYAPGSATYLQVNASYDDGIPIQYTFYLGENLTTDFNILPNRAYYYDFNIAAKGDAAADTRIKELGLVDFKQTELANCYIINPAQTAGVKRKFMIPVRRVDDFWGNNGYENSPNFTLGSSKNWTVSVVAANFDNSDGKLTLTKSTGKGKDDYFEFTVEPGTVGNAIVALHTGDGQACWSWHLWITDYSPDEAYTKVPQDGVYNYSVSGGAVHRYEGTLWEGEYAKRFIMDRNLGAWGVGYPDEYGNGTLYFQYGRKDPFFGGSSYGFKDFKLYAYNDIVKDDPSPTAPLLFAINNPLTFISGDWGAWTIGNKYNPSTVDKEIIWMDPLTSSKNSADPHEKSIFDPCPPGYCVPKYGTWNDFRLQSQTRPSTNINAGAEMLRGFKAFSKGFSYWPYPESDASDVVPEQTVFYPAVGVRQPIGSWYGLSSNVYMSTSTIVSSSQLYLFHATSTTANPGRTDMRHNHGAPVRCVTVRDVK